jgi:hypothetical protein
VTILQEKFEKLVDASASMSDNSKKHLDRRVPTRWNSDFACLAAHVYFEEPVRALTTDPKLGAFALTEAQWTLAKDLVDVLEASPRFSLCVVVAHPDYCRSFEISPTSSRVQKCH